MTSGKKPVFNDSEDDLVRCRRVRDEFNARFKTLDELFAWLEKLEQNEPSPKRGRATARTAKRKPQAKPRATASKAAARSSR
jgi:hypothetical protein